MVRIGWIYHNRRFWSTKKENWGIFQEIAAEQFLEDSTSGLKTNLREKQPETIEKKITLLDSYIEIRKKYIKFNENKTGIHFARANTITPSKKVHFRTSEES